MAIVLETKCLKKRTFRNNHIFHRQLQSDQIHCGYFDPVRHWIVVEDRKSIEILYEQGCFGRFAGREICIAKQDSSSKLIYMTSNQKRPHMSEPESTESNSSDSGADEIERPSEGRSAPIYYLNIEEALFISQCLKKLVITYLDKPLQLNDVWTQHCDQKINGKSFDDFYVAYVHYRARGWTVRRGDNYGVDYVLYNIHPNLYHSSYGVCIERSDDEKTGDRTVTWRHLATLSRILRAVKKTLILCRVRRKSVNVQSRPLPTLEDFSIEEVQVDQWFVGKHFVDDSMND